MTARQKSRMVTRKGKVEQPAALLQGASPRFSVILCTYNRCNLVLTALASLRRQTLPYNQFEVIVVDNGSSDGTLSAVRTYVGAGRQKEKQPVDSWKVQCLCEPLNGLAYARNTGLLAASGEIAVFLDDDAIADPHFLERLWDAYQETGADAIGGRVELRWEAKRPHWLSDELLEMLGYFAPSSERTQLDNATSFSSSSFSVKIEALRAIGYFSPFLSKRRDLPASAEVSDLCRRLRETGYTLWYEPGAVVVHRASAPRLVRPFFVGRAYWQGRSEVLAHYEDASFLSTPALLQAAWNDLREITYLFLVHRPLLRLAGRSSTERLLAAIGQARSWGRLRQRLAFLEHAPAEWRSPAVLLVRPAVHDPTLDLLVRSLHLQNVRCTIGTGEIPLSWLWQHRAYVDKAIGVLHFYRPGALKLTHKQRQQLWFRLWLAHRLGIRIVTTDVGGWWQSTRGLRFLSHRMLERKLMHQSDAIVGYSRQPDQLYPDKKLRRRVRFLPHPGFRGYYPPALRRNSARQQLGFPTGATGGGQVSSRHGRPPHPLGAINRDPTDGFAYLCLASIHTERELIYLLEAFWEITQGKLKEESASTHQPLQLLLVGTPGDKKMPMRILKLAARNPAIHLHLAAPAREDFALYMGAIDALVLPHFAIHTAGILEMAILGLSYERVVVAPNLPRFRGMLPPKASVLYEAASRGSLANALIKAQKLRYHLKEKEAAALDAESGWGQYAHRLLKIYQELLGRAQ